MGKEILNLNRNDNLIFGLDIAMAQLELDINKGKVALHNGKNLVVIDDKFEVKWSDSLIVMEPNEVVQWRKENDN